MPKHFEGEEEPKNFSENETKKIQDLVSKVWEVIGWDLGKMCATTEELDFVDKAQEAIREIAGVLDMPSGQLWEKQESRPITSKTFLPDDLKKLRASLDAIEEVLDWDISGTEEELVMIRDARESLEALKEIF